jgi:hypothetical protein
VPELGNGFAVDPASLKSASAEEAAAIVAALAHFIADTTSTAPAPRALSTWLTAARAEAVEREPRLERDWS